MNFKAFFLSLILPVALLGQVAVAKEEAAPAPVQLTPVQQMAEILMQIDQKPTKEQKKALEALANNKMMTEHIRNLAGTIKNINGTVQDQDKPRVYAVLRAIVAGDDERELAKILLKFNGKADAKLLKRLEKLMPPKPAPAAKEEAKPAEKEKKEKGKEKKAEEEKGKK